jgi:undecaprenyl diphosphate synthase
VAIIMDGNGRWARRRGLPRLAGHRAGVDNLQRILDACRELDIRILTLYAFSTENWRRPTAEVQGLMLLLREVIEDQLDELDRRGVQVRHVGWLDGIPRPLQNDIRRAVERTAANSDFYLNVAFNYGSRAEIVRAVRQAIRDGVKPDELDEGLFESYLTTSGLPDPDLIIRTSGEMRLSNFLLWQAAYAEIYCTPTLWPDFDKAELMKAVLDYSERERRLGGLPGRPDPALPSGRRQAGRQTGLAGTDGV